MITLTLGFVYGTGFALTLVGGTLWLMFMNALKYNIHPLLLLGAAVVWPITLSWAAIKFCKIIKEKK